jgi:hypothetical protein
MMIQVRYGETRRAALQGETPSLQLHVVRNTVRAFSNRLYAANRHPDLEYITAGLSKSQRSQSVSTHWVPPQGLQRNQVT